jgi:hypothetical protein
LGKGEAPFNERRSSSSSTSSDQSETTLFSLSNRRAGSSPGRRWNLGGRLDLTEVTGGTDFEKRPEGGFPCGSQSPSSYLKRQKTGWRYFKKRKEHFYITDSEIKKKPYFHPSKGSSFEINPSWIRKYYFGIRNPELHTQTLFQAVFRIRIFGPLGSGSGSVIICTYPAPDQNLYIKEQKNKDKS